MHGRYRDTLPMATWNPNLNLGTFENGNAMAAVLWNDTESPIALTDTMAKPGWTLFETVTFHSKHPTMPAELQPQQLLIAIYKRKQK